MPGITGVEGAGDVEAATSPLCGGGVPSFGGPEFDIIFVKPVFYITDSR